MDDVGEEVIITRELSNSYSSHLAGFTTLGKGKAVTEPGVLG